MVADRENRQAGQMMKKWLQTAKPDDRGESLRALQEVSKDRITSVANQYFTKLWGVGGSQGRGAPSIEYRDRQKAKEESIRKLFWRSTTRSQLHRVKDKL
jgi:hypothetical protein